MAEPLRRRGLALLGLSGRTLLVSVVVALLIAAAYRLDLRADWSYYGRFTLHPELLRIIGEQDEPVSITAVWPKPLNDGPMGSLHGGLQRIAATSPLLRYTHIDREIDKPELQAFTEAHGEPQPGSIYLARDERLFRIQATAQGETTLQRDIGGALVHLGQEETRPVYWLLGHGELHPEGTGPDGGSALWRAIGLAGFQPTTLRQQDISRLGRLPDDGVLLIAGPTANMGAEFPSMLQTYLRDGGSALILADDRCPPELAVTLRLRGVLLGVGIPSGLSDEPSRLFDVAAEGVPPLLVQSASQALLGQDQRFDRLLLGSEQIQPNPITQRVLRSGRQLLSPRSTPLMTPRTPPLAQMLGRDTDALYAQAGTPPFSVYEILFALESGSAWLTQAASDWSAPAQAPQAGTIFPLGVAVENEPHSQSIRPDRRARLVVWSSRRAGSDAALRFGEFANEDLLLDALAWLDDRPEPTVIPPADRDPIQVDASDQQMWILFAILVVVVPCCCLGGAMLSWWERR